jgi:DNA-binding IclR family transcriptional regulator
MAEIPRGSAQRTIHLLKIIAGLRTDFSLNDLSERAGLPTSSVHRLLQALARAGLVERGPRQSYRPGRELYRLASQLVASFDLTRSARPMLEELAANWHETAVLCAYSPASRRAVIADVVMVPQPLRVGIEKNAAIELPWGSMGRAILAFLSAGEIEAILREAKAGPISGRPRLPREEMQAELAEIRRRGFARYSNAALDLSGVAAPVFGVDAAILGCIGVTMTTGRYLQHEQDELAIAVRDAAMALSALAAGA